MGESKTKRGKGFPWGRDDEGHGGGGNGGRLRYAFPTLCLGPPLVLSILPQQVKQGLGSQSTKAGQGAVGRFQV